MTRIRIRLDARGTWSNGCTGHVVRSDGEFAHVVYEGDRLERAIPMPVTSIEPWPEDAPSFTEADAVAWAEKKGPGPLPSAPQSRVEG